ncbi:hypothetical protein CAPTEDRAFT_117818, partial [Capitella teleta]
FWDIVVLTTADEEQRLAYELQLEEKQRRSELPLGLPYLVFADPPGPKAGCGGSTMFVLSKMHELYGDDLYCKRILLLNAGGQSQRLPTASVLGKIFTALPCGTPMLQVLDLKLALFMPFLQRMGPGVFHGCSDTIELFDLGDGGNWTFEKPGFTCLAHPSPLDIGTTHGVFVLDPKEASRGDAAELRKCLEVLQKPSIKRMREKGAVLNSSPFISEEHAYTDSGFFFDCDAAKKLLEFYQKEAPLQCEIDSYGDFLQALGPNASVEYTCDLRNVSVVEPTLVRTREKIFNLLKGTAINIVALNASKFYHLGTTKEYLHHFCHDPVLSRELDFFATGVFNSFIPSTDTRGCMMHNYFAASSQIPASSIVEYCSFEASVVIGDNCIISGCCYEPSDPKTVLEIPPDILLHTIPINSDEFVTIAFNVKENIKKKADNLSDAKNLTYLGSTLEQISKQRKSNFADLFSGGTFTLWHAKLFPVQSSMHDSLKSTLMMIKQVYTDSYSWVSMADILRLKDVRRMVTRRSVLYDKISANLPSN